MNKKSILKSGLLLLVVGSLSACGGGSVSIEEAETKLSAISGNAIDLSPFDSDGDKNLSGHELVAVWETLTLEQKEIVASQFGYSVQDAENYINSLTDVELETNIGGGINKLNNDLNIAAAHYAGITGEGVTIAVIDSDSHGETVTNIVEGIAISSDVTFYDTNSGDYIDTWNLTNAEHDEIAAADIVNMSYGYTLTEEEFAAAGFTDIHSLDQIEAYNGSEDTEIWNNLIVIAAGNDGENGTCADLTTCNAEALYQIAFDETVIVVGSLNDDGTALESYSNQAGLLQDYFISAPVSNRGGELSGTSFAAPYVTGVAALIMDKWDNTDAEMTRNIIFDTADDLGAPGVDSVFGHGALNVGRALSPIGSLN